MICIGLELPGFGFDRRKGDEVSAVFNAALEPDRITAADAFFEFMQGKGDVAVAADDETVLILISLFVRITARAGIKEG